MHGKPAGDQSVSAGRRRAGPRLLPVWQGHGAGSLLTLTSLVLCDTGQPSSSRHLGSRRDHPLLLHTARSSKQFQECLSSCPLSFCRAMWTLRLAVPGPGAQGQKTKSSWLALDSASLGTCPSRPSRWPQRPRELRAGKEEAWHRDLACPDVASRDPAIFLWTLPPREPCSCPGYTGSPPQPSAALLLTI